ncbi:MAG: hypothetical protein M3P49_09860 [Actinomycetota bacterium]|nr:hypothetical protein [Actinomycetota bacterium]
MRMEEAATSGGDSWVIAADAEERAAFLGRVDAMRNALLDVAAVWDAGDQAVVGEYEAAAIAAVMRQPELLRPMMVRVARLVLGRAPRSPRPVRRRHRIRRRADIRPPGAPTTPDQVDHPQIKEFAIQAAWVAELQEAAGELEDLVVNMADPGDEGASESMGERGNRPYELALEIVRERYEEVDRELEDRIHAWLAEDPEHWPVFRLVVLDPWRNQDGGWRADVPHWVLVLGTDTIAAHIRNPPYGQDQPPDQ